MHVFAQFLSLSAIGTLLALGLGKPTPTEDNATPPTLPPTVSLQQSQLQTTPPSVRPFDYLPRPPVAQIATRSGEIDIRLNNTVGAPVTYQVVTDTDQRSLPANDEVILRELSLPVSVFLHRPDGGLVDVTVATIPGQLQITLDAATDLSNNVRSIEIDRSGYVFLE